MSLEPSEDISPSETGPKTDMEAVAYPSISASNDEHTPADSIQEKHKEDKAVAAEPGYITGLRLFLIMFTIFVSTLLAALEIGIIATAIPGITDDFYQLDDVGWYGSATFLLVGASSPMWGKLYKYLPVRWVYMCSVLFYLVGSIVAAVAPNNISVIVGRAIQGLGAAGTLGGSVLVINLVAEPKQRPVLIGSWMGVFMVSTILGPIIGGAFYQWRLLALVLLDQPAAWRTHSRPVSAVLPGTQACQTGPSLLDRGSFAARSTQIQSFAWLTGMFCPGSSMGWSKQSMEYRSRYCPIGPLDCRHHSLFRCRGFPRFTRDGPIETPQASNNMG